MAEKVVRPSFEDELAEVESSRTSNLSIHCGVAPGKRFAEALFDDGGEVDKELMAKNTAMAAAVNWKGGQVVAYFTGTLTVTGSIIDALTTAKIDLPAGRRETY